MRRIREVLKKITMIPPTIISAIWEKSDGHGYRSTVLRPLGWLLTLCMAGAISAASVPSAPQWLTVLFGIAAGASVMIYLGAFIYCLLKMPDGLRTERYSIQKMAIEKGFDQAAKDMSLVVPGQIPVPKPIIDMPSSIEGPPCHT